MPTLAIFDGIAILMYWHDHAPPHFHVRAGDMKGKFEISTGRMLGGRLDRRTERKVREWTERNREMLITAWNDCQMTGGTTTTE